MPGLKPARLEMAIAWSRNAGLGQSISTTFDVRYISVRTLSHFCFADVEWLFSQLVQHAVPQKIFFEVVSDLFMEPYFKSNYNFTSSITSRSTEQTRFPDSWPTDFICVCLNSVSICVSCSFYYGQGYSEAEAVERGHHHRSEFR